MTPAGAFSPVLGVGGRAALLPATRCASLRSSATSQGSPLTQRTRMEAAAGAGAGVFSSVAALGGFGARLPATRSTSLRFAAASLRFTALGASLGGRSSHHRHHHHRHRWRLPFGRGAGRNRSPSTSHALDVSAFRHRRFTGFANGAAVQRPSASIGYSAATISEEGAPALEEVVDTPPAPPNQGLFVRFAEVVKKLKEEARRNGFAFLLLIVSIGIATLASGKHPYSDYATSVIGICEKAEKFHKIVSHFVPIIFNIWNRFR